MKTINAFGGARKQIEIPINQLFLDSQNPRLPERAQGKKEEDVLYSLYKEFDLDELALSMSENGYFDEEPLVAIPKILPTKFKNKSPQILINNDDYKIFLEEPTTEFIVVEGNRRLATIKILLNIAVRKKLNIKSWPAVRDAVKIDIEKPPVIVYSTRKEVLPYLGVRHIAGIKKWESFAKARYVASMISDKMTLDDIEKLIGDRSSSIKKIYICYRLVRQGEKIGINTEKAKENFSFLLLSLGQSSIKEFLGLKGRLSQHTQLYPISKSNEKNLKYFLSWIYGDGKKSPVICESRDITNKLSQVLQSPEAIKYLIKNNNLDDAFDRTGGEENMLLKNLSVATKYLNKSFRLIRKHRNREVKERIFDIKDLVEKLIKEF